MSQPASIRAIVTVVVMVAVAACTPLQYPASPLPEIQPSLSPQQPDALSRLGYDLTLTMPGTEVLTALPGSAACARTGPSVIRSAFPERILFATASDQPSPEAAGVLHLLADQIRHDAPGSELTVLGHTDAVGSDAYNIDLSRRRALSVMHDLAAAGLDPSRLSAVAIGKRQPIADNATPEGRASNRRVEFLISGCLAANLGVVRAQASSGANARSPVDVIRLDPASAYGLATVGSILLARPSDEPAAAAAVAPALLTHSTALQPPAGVARPAPAPHYQPRTLSPDVQRNPLGPAVPF